jgi:hypothetical protein
MTTQIERTLQQECMIRLHSAAVRGELRAIYYPIPNGVYLPSRTNVERTLAARIVHQLKMQGGMTPGAPDLVFLARHCSGGIELKRPTAKLLFETRRRGVLSREQREQRDRFASMGVNWAVCTSWEEVHDSLVEWGMLVRLDRPDIVAE